MKKSILIRLEKIKQFKIEIEYIQKKCQHKNKITTYDASVGNYDPSADRYWEKYHCQDCNKYWSSDITYNYV